MPHSTARSHPPHAGDPICSSVDAIAIVSLAIHRPLEPETIAFLLDDHRCSNTITVVSGTKDPDSVLTVVECMAMAASRVPGLSAVVLATVRPRCAQFPAGDVATNTTATVPGDLDRWMEANEIADAHGIELIEWFIVGPSGVNCPRELFGEPERW
jgi:hypothetical protein